MVGAIKKWMILSLCLLIGGMMPMGGMQRAEANGGILLQEHFESKNVNALAGNGDTAFIS